MLVHMEGDTSVVGSGVNAHMEGETSVVTGAEQLPNFSGLETNGHDGEYVHEAESLYHSSYLKIFFKGCKI